MSLRTPDTDELFLPLLSLRRVLSHLQNVVFVLVLALTEETLGPVGFVLSLIQLKQHSSADTAVETFDLGTVDSGPQPR